jgi:hypothetical protein
MKEEYYLTIDASVQSSLDLFEVWTDTIYLGFSGITCWDAFDELMRECFEYRDICVCVTHADLSGIDGQDLHIYNSILSEIASEHTEKLRIRLAD